MPLSKDDPLGERPYSHSNPTTLWLDREHMEESRDAYFKSYASMLQASGSRVSWRAWSTNDDTSGVTVNQISKDIAEVRVEWDIAYAASVAAFEFLMSGKMRPGP